MNKINVAYLRVSTETQTEKYGLDLQRQKIIEYCDKYNVTIGKWYIDRGYSGKQLDRPDIQNLLDDAEKGLIDTVYIYKLDRISRDTIDTLDLLYRILPKYDIKVVSMTEDIKTDNPMDRVMVTMNAAMSQYEREVIRMRMSAGMIERVKRGLWMGGGRVPYGYYYDRNDGILHIDEEQAEQIRQAYKLYLGGKSCGAISRLLGFKGERIVSQILKRKSNIGLIEYNGNIYQGKHKAIIDEKTFYQTQEMMKKRSTNSHIANDHMLTGLCYCGSCGARMRYQKWGAYHKIVCYSTDKYKEHMSNFGNCDNKKVYAKTIENEVVECFKMFAINLKNTQVEKSDNISLLDKSIKNTKTKVKKMYDVYFTQNSENLLELITEEEKKLKELEKELQTAIAEEHHAENAISVDEIRRIADIWDSLSVKEQNKILKECVEKIIIENDNIEIHFRNH